MCFERNHGESCHRFTDGSRDIVDHVVDYEPDLTRKRIHEKTPSRWSASRVTAADNLVYSAHIPSYR